MERVVTPHEARECASGPSVRAPFLPEVEAPRVAWIERMVVARLGYQAAYGADPGRVAADEPVFARLRTWAEAAGVPSEPLAEDVLVLAGAPGGGRDAAPADTREQDARALGGLWAMIHPDLKPMVRREVVARFMVAAPEAAGVRTHPLGPALLSGVEEAAGGGEAGAEARERARRSLDRDLSIARVVARLGSVAAERVPATLLRTLVKEPEAVVRALGAVMQRRGHPIRTSMGLAEALREADPGGATASVRGAHSVPPPERQAALVRAVNLTEALASEVCREPVRVYFGPPGLLRPPGLDTLADLAARAEPTEPARSPPARATVSAPCIPSVPEASRSAQASIRMRAWRRRLARRLPPQPAGPSRRAWVSPRRTAPGGGSGSDRRDVGSSADGMEPRTRWSSLPHRGPPKMR